jgi:hypothetical protein
MKRILSYITGKNLGNTGTQNRRGGKKKDTHPSDILGSSKLNNAS